MLLGAIIEAFLCDLRIGLGLKDPLMLSFTILCCLVQLITIEYEKEILPGRRQVTLSSRQTGVHSETLSQKKKRKKTLERYLSS